jgi:hypothetical protein
MEAAISCADCCGLLAERRQQQQHSAAVAVLLQKGLLRSLADLK